MRPARLAILKKLIVHVVARQPSVIASTAVGIVSSGIEVLAISSLIPISLLATGLPIKATSPWRRIPAALGFEPNVKFYATVFITLLLVRTISSGINMALVASTYRRLIAHFSSRALDAFISHLSFGNIQKQSVGHFIAVTGDEANRAAQIIMYIMRIIPVFTLMAFYLATLIYQSWIFGMMLLAFFGITILCLGEAFRVSLQLGRTQQDQARDASTHLLESLNGLRTVRGFNGETYVASRYEKMMADYVRTCFKIDVVNLLSRTLPATLLLALILVLTLNFIEISWFTANLSTIFVGLMMVLRVLPLAGQLLDYGMRLLADLKAAENVGLVLDAIQEDTDRQQRTAHILPARATIERIDFDHVTFRYTDDTPLILNNFTYSFLAGRSYAIVGPSGIGKSSLIDLFLKFYAPSSGAIRINGIDISDLPSSWIRARVAFAEQTTRLFYDTVLRNVLFGREVDRDAGMAALRVVGLGDFLETLPDGADTVLTYQGSNFSGGQRQRVGLARALLLPADALVIDEGTSALDPATKTALVEQILARYRDKIVIFVTHDMSVVEAMDEVVTLSPQPQDPVS